MLPLRNTFFFNTDNGNGTYTAYNYGACLYCGLTGSHTCHHTFEAEGAWNEASCWNSGHVPVAGNDVIIAATCHVPSGYQANASAISLPYYDTLTIKDDGELPLNFKAQENGEYTLTVTGTFDFDYLHLIDNLTGADIDLLQNPSYTFNARTTDYASRFRLVFSGNGPSTPSTGSGADEPFAFISNGEIRLIADACDASLQVIDVMGRIIVNSDGAHPLSTTGIAPGVYVLRLVNGKDVKVQKLTIVGNNVH